jgi:hypothetical protein
MKIYYEIAFLLFLICLKVETVSSMKFCCCIYKKDPFRGFEKSSGEVVSIEMPESLEKDEIGNKILKLCHAKNGLPSYENIERLKKGNFNLDKQTCEKECSFLILEMNEKFDIEQEENRMEKAKKLRDRRKRLANQLESKISDNVNNLYKGGRCLHGVIQDNNKKSNDIINNFIDHLLHIDKNKKPKNELKAEFDDLSFLSLSDENEYSECLEKDNNFLFEQISLTNNRNDTHHSNKISAISTENNLLEPDATEGSLKREINNLDNQILYLEKKNKRPINFILDRFSIPDDILIMMLKIFELTLEDTVRRMRIYLEDTIYFQFKIADKIRPYHKKKFA